MTKRKYPYGGIVGNKPTVSSSTTAVSRKLPLPKRKPDVAVTPLEAKQLNNQFERLQYIFNSTGQWNQPDREWFGGSSEPVFINDAGNLERKPYVIYNERTGKKFFLGGFMGAAGSMIGNNKADLFKLGSGAVDGAVNAKSVAEGVENPYASEVQKSRNIANTGIAVAGQINPLIGLGLKAGQAIGSASKNPDGTYKSKVGEFAANSFDPTTGIDNIMSNLKDPSGSGLLNMATLGLAGKSTRQGQIEEAIEVANKKKVQDLITNSQGTLSAYPTNGVIGGGFKYGGTFKGYGAMGMQLPMPIEGDGTQIASDAAVYEGNTHENGGIPLDNGVEIEDNEVIQQDRVYSDRLKPSKITKHILPFKIDNKDTFASASEELLKKKGKYEENAVDMYSKNTAKAMGERIDSSLEVLFADQQMQNGDGMGQNSNPMTKRPYGGILTPAVNAVTNKLANRAYPGPTYIQPDSNISVEQNEANAIDNFHNALRFRSSLTGPYNNVVRNDDPRIQQSGNAPKPVYTSGMYMNVDPNAIRKADSVINNVRPLVLARQGKPLVYAKKAYGGPIEEIPRPYDLDSRFYNIGTPEFKGVHIPSNDAFTAPLKEFLPNNSLKAAYDFSGVQAPKEEYAMYDFSGVENPREESPIAYDFSNVDAGLSEYSRPATTAGSTNPAPSLKGKFDFGDLAAAAGTIANQAAISRMKTNTPERTINKPIYSYQNLSTPILNRNAANFREGVLSAQRYGAATPGAVASMYASKLNTDADIQSQEAARKQQSIEQYTNRGLTVDQFNAGQLSRNDQLNNARYNEKLGLTQSNINNYVTSLLGNKSRRDLNALDKDKAIIMSSMEGGRGITARMLQDPMLEESLRRVFGDDYVERIKRQKE